jgi:hypothetical protein
MEGDCSDRVTERDGNTAKSEQTHRNHIGNDTFYVEGFTAENFGGTASAVGENSEGITANRNSENNGPGSREALHVGSRPPEDRGVSAGTMGEN